MAEQESGYQHGSMEVSGKERTFENFVKICVLVTLHVFAILIFLAIIGT